MLPGRGVCGVVDGGWLAVGGIDLLDTCPPDAIDDGAIEARAQPDAMLAPPDLDATACPDRAIRSAPAEGSVAVVLDRNGALGRLDLVETPREGAARAIAALGEMGVAVGVLSGDRSASAIAPVLLPVDDVELGLLPEDKVKRIRALCASARSDGGAIAMVGDGINDAPALAAADLGMAVAEATDLARLSASVVILGGDLSAVPWLVKHARRVRRVAHQNLAWAFGYNAIAVALAATGALTPLLASLAMIGSSLAVVANARRLA